MKKFFACALLTVGIISFNAIPAKAINEVKTNNNAAHCVSVPGQGDCCYYVPWLGYWCKSW